MNIILGQDHFFKDLDHRSRSIKWSLSLPLKDHNLNNDQIIIKIIDQDHLPYVLWSKKILFPFKMCPPNLERS